MPGTGCIRNNNQYMPFRWDVADASAPKFRLAVIERPLHSPLFAFVVDAAKTANRIVHQGEREYRLQGWPNGRVNFLFNYRVFACSRPVVRYQGQPGCIVWCVRNTPLPPSTILKIP